MRINKNPKHGSGLFSEVSMRLFYLSVLYFDRLLRFFPGPSAAVAAFGVASRTFVSGVSSSVITIFPGTSASAAHVSVLFRFV